MAHRLAPGVAGELAEIYDHIAGQSGSAEIAGRVIDAIVDRGSCS